MGTAALEIGRVGSFLSGHKGLLRRCYFTLEPAHMLVCCQTANTSSLPVENVPLCLIRECVEIRQQRPTRELVRDEVEYEMQMLEKEHMETCALYQQTLFACSNELKRLDD